MTKEKLQLTAKDLRAGDRFTNRGRRYEVIGVAEGKYGTYNVTAKPLNNETVNFDYTTLIEVLR